MAVGRERCRAGAGRMLLQRDLSSAGGVGGSVRIHGTARGSAEGRGGNSRHTEQRRGRSMPRFPNTASQEQLPLAQHSPAVRHKQRDPKNPRQAEAEPWEGSQPWPGGALALLGPPLRPTSGLPPPFPAAAGLLRSHRDAEERERSAYRSRTAPMGNSSSCSLKAASVPST